MAHHTVNSLVVFRNKRALLVCSSELLVDTMVLKTKLRLSTRKALLNRPNPATLLQASLRRAATQPPTLALKLNSNSQVRLLLLSRANTKLKANIHMVILITLVPTMLLT